MASLISKQCSIITAAAPANMMRIWPSESSCLNMKSYNMDRQLEAAAKCSRAATNVSSGRPNYAAPIHAGILRVQLPAPIHCLFPVRFHPEYESVKAECDQWALSLFQSIAPSPSLYLPYLEGLHSSLPSWAYSSSHVSRHRLLLATKLTIWLFMLDDAIDEADPQTAAELGRGFISVLKSTTSGSSAGRSLLHTASTDARIETFMERLRLEVWEEICRDMSPDVQSRYVGECVRSMEAMKELWRLRRYSRQKAAGQAAVGINDGSSSTEESRQTSMMELRLLDGFCWTFTTLLEYALGIELPDSAERTPMGRMVQTMIKAAGKQALCVNELLSCGKELANKDGQSMVGVVLAHRHEWGGTAQELIAEKADAMQEVMREMWETVQEQERMCADILRQIRILAHEAGGEDQLVSLMYAEALCDFMAGHLYWSTRSGRYHGPHPIPWNTTPSYLVIPSAPLRSLNFLHPN